MKKNCLLFLVDSLRFDVLPDSEQDQGVLAKHDLIEKLELKNLQKLVEKGSIIPRLHTSYTATPPAVASLMTGKYPREHGLYGFQCEIFEETKTLADYFKESGYVTIIFNGIKLLKHNGLGDRFDHYLEGPVNRLIEEIKRHNENNRPVFIYYHTMDVHHPYLLSHYPPNRSYHDRAIEKATELAELLGFDYNFKRSDALERARGEDYPFRASGDQLLWQFLKTAYHIHIKRDQKIDNPIEYMANWYVEGVNHFDAHSLAPLVDFLFEDEHGKNTNFLLTADHGETIRENSDLLGFEHSGPPDQDLIRIPGLLYTAGEELLTVDEISYSSMVDLAPTLLGLHGLDSNNQNFSGYNLLKTITEERSLYSEYSDDKNKSKDDFPREAFINWETILTAGGYKFTRAGLPLKEKDYELPVEKFVETAFMKRLLVQPDETVINKYSDELRANDSRQEREKFVLRLDQQRNFHSPTLTRWREDHLERDNLLGRKPPEPSYQKVAEELEKRLNKRFPEPEEVEKQRSKEDKKLSANENEELKEALTDLGYL